MLLPRAGSSSRLTLRHFTTTPRALAPPSKELLALPTLKDDDHHALAREWLDAFAADDVPKTSYVISYARSSGPGGQHVNKTNSKAVLHCDIHRAKGDWLPPFVVPELQKTQYYHAPNLVFQSQVTRSAPKNLQAALANLHETIAKAAKGAVRGETSEEQKQRVVALGEAEAKRRRIMKEKAKMKKASRRGDWD